MTGHWRFFLIPFGGVAIVLLVAITIFILLSGGTSSLGPQEAFEANIQALLDEEWELAYSYLAPNCNISIEQIRQTAITFDYRVWTVGKVFLADGEAMLYLDKRNGFQHMIETEDGWKITCRFRE